MSITLEHPYLARDVSWLKGNLHCHSNRTDGSRPAQEVIDAYADLGYDFLALSDHDILSDPAELDPRGMVLLSGNEVSAKGPHLLHIGARSRVEPDEERQVVLDAAAAAGGFTVINHPNWQQHFNHCPLERLEAWNGYLGMEIYNAVIRELPGSPLATNKWDMLLGRGRRVWGFANDDSHRPSHDGQAWNMVQVGGRSADAVLEALSKGRFYASTGVMLSSIRVDGATVEVATENASRITVVTDYGKRLAQEDGSSASFTVPEEVGYVRFECWGAGESMAWTQPFFIRR